MSAYPGLILVALGVALWAGRAGYRWARAEGRHAKPYGPRAWWLDRRAGR